MLILAVVLALVLGWCTGGRLARLEEARLGMLYLPVAAVVLQRLSTAPWALLLSYLLLLLFYWRNRHLRKSALLLAAGSLCNLAVISANAWRMPVAAWAVDCLSPAVAEALLAGEIPMYAAAGPETRLLFLGDVIYCPIPLIGGFASVGDLLLMAGVFFCVLAVMAPGKLPRWLRRG